MKMKLGTICLLVCLAIWGVSVLTKGNDFLERSIAVKPDKILKRVVPPTRRIMTEEQISQLKPKSPRRYFERGSEEARSCDLYWEMPEVIPKGLAVVELHFYEYKNGVKKPSRVGSIYHNIFDERTQDQWRGIPDKNVEGKFINGNDLRTNGLMSFSPVFPTKVRFPVYEDKGQRLHSLGYRAGKIYNISYGSPGRRGSFIRIPDDIKENELIVYEIDIDDSQVMHWHYPQDLVHVNGIFKGFNANDDWRISFPLHLEYSYDVKIKEDGSFKKVIPAEAMRAGITVSNLSLKDGKKRNYVNYYIPRTRKFIKLPEDADIVALDKDVFDFWVKIPSEILPKDAAEVMLVAEDGGLHSPALSKAVITASEGDTLFKEGGKVKLTFVPGEYYLACRPYGWRFNEVFGKITVKKEDKGKVLEYEPL